MGNVLESGDVSRITTLQHTFLPRFPRWILYFQHGIRTRKTQSRAGNGAIPRWILYFQRGISVICAQRFDPLPARETRGDPLPALETCRSANPARDSCTIGVPAPRG